jgi:hypothetical protein
MNCNAFGRFTDGDDTKFEVTEGVEKGAKVGWEVT